MKNIYLYLFSVLLITLSQIGFAMSDLNDETQTTPSCTTYVEWTGKNIDEMDMSVLEDREYRIIRPDSMVTMDFVPERLNIHVDENGTIIKQDCG
jgi:hypothetical protein